VNLKTTVSKLLYQWTLLLNPFCFGATEWLHFTTHVCGHSAISPFLGGFQLIQFSRLRLPQVDFSNYFPIFHFPVLCVIDFFNFQRLFDLRPLQINSQHLFSLVFSNLKRAFHICVFSTFFRLAAAASRAKPDLQRNVDQNFDQGIFTMFPDQDAWGRGPPWGLHG